LVSGCDGNARALEADLHALRAVAPALLACTGDILTQTLLADPLRAVPDELTLDDGRVYVWHGIPSARARARQPR